MNGADEVRVDVAVVGGGTAGAWAARAAADAGCAVLLIDRRAVPGRPVQCGEWIPRALAVREPLPGGVALHSLAGMRTAVWDGGAGGEPPRVAHAAFLRAPGVMIDRAALDAGLVRRALDAGAEFWAGAVAAAPLPGGDGIAVRRRGRLLRVRARVVIGADGPLSAVGRWIGAANRHFVVARQQVLPVQQPAGAEAEVYFHRDLPGGYAWFFPKGRTANVGLGVNPALADPRCLAARLDWFVERLAGAGRVVPRPLSTSGGWIPVGGPPPILGRGPFLLAGDAAGLAHPLTGAGIAAALESGRRAGEFAAHAVRTGRDGAEDYTRLIHSTLGRPLRVAAKARAWRDGRWTACRRDGFAELIRRAWPGSEGYRAWSSSGICPGSENEIEGSDVDGRADAGAI